MRTRRCLETRSRQFGKSGEKRPTAESVPGPFGSLWVKLAPVSPEAQSSTPRLTVSALTVIVESIGAKADPSGETGAFPDCLTRRVI